MPITLTLRTATRLPIEVEGILPAALLGKPVAEIGQLPIFHGKERQSLDSIFSVTGDPDDLQLVFQGDCRSVHWIGANMSKGSIRIGGNAGRHLGSQMRGGEILVEGNAGDWIGAEMRGGRIVVRGNAGHQAGAAYRGSPRGMRGGEIFVFGDAGNEIGARMRRGLIAVAGRAGDSPGYGMLAGTILLFGEGGIRPGGNMKRGTIAFFLQERPALLPTFTRGATLAPSFMSPLLRSLSQRGFPMDALSPNAIFEMYSGDALEGGRGEILFAVGGELLR